jgi:hypothetical protein
VSCRNTILTTEFNIYRFQAMDRWEDVEEDSKRGEILERVKKLWRLARSSIFRRRRRFSPSGAPSPIDPGHFGLFYGRSSADSITE